MANFCAMVGATCCDDKAMKIGNALSSVACRLFKIAAQAGSLAIMNQPTTSWMWCCQDFLEMPSDVKGWFGNRDVCLDGAPWRNPTSFHSNEKKQYRPYLVSVIAR